MSESATVLRASVLDRVLEDFRSLTAELPSEDATRATRAAARLGELGWPSARDEQWRYTNLRAFDRIAGFRPGPAARPQSAAMELPPALPGFERIVFVDGRHASGTHPALTGQPKGSSTAWPPEQRLGLLTDMFAGDSARLAVRGEAAIELLFVSTNRGASYPRLELRLEADSRLRLVERHLGCPSGGASVASLVACGLILELAQDSELTHFRLQQCDRHCVFTDTVAARLQERARYLVRSVAVGASSARTSANIELAGRGASLAWASIAAGRGEQVHDVALKVRHVAPETATEELFRGIADERARVAFSGHIQIESTAPGSQARQSLRGLIEGSAEIDLRPRLEILTDDVRASHGATTGRLDEELLFYLLARGIDRPTARSLLKWAFLGDVLRQIEQPALRAEAERLAAGQLPDVPQLGALS
ncbi:MAG TPA: SufD family Fe-S cluster assembly protein [Steroidobacteraceae bacterium]|jgi:Fe-S cluster assembly protein SufD